ncbi:FBP domain-containing protein [Pseudoclavibacter albus]|uniref:FBP domain-containing protein n=1 Tax=Pseudoclavibacter albus TaxID=272241 RepID=UPI002882F302|nr:FBP domain-containing protein [Pseudoclavibacter alba]
MTEREIRDTFINASRKEIRSLTLPAGFEAIDWDRLDYFGWQDPKVARRAYVVVPTLEGTLRAILFRRADATPRGRPSAPGVPT